MTKGKASEGLGPAKISLGCGWNSGWDLPKVPAKTGREEGRRTGERERRSGKQALGTLLPTEEMARWLRSLSALPEHSNGSSQLCNSWSRGSNTLAQTHTHADRQTGKTPLPSPPPKKQNKTKYPCCYELYELGLKAHGKVGPNSRPFVFVFF